MKNLFVFLPVLMVFTAEAQQVIKYVDAPLKEYTVILETEKAKISFNIDDLRAEWERIKELLKSRGDDQYTHGVKAMEWLNSRRGVVHLVAAYNGETMQSNDALNLMLNLTHCLGAKLVRDGKTKVYRKDKAIYQPEYEYKLLSTAPWSDVYGFYFSDGHQMFLKGEIVGEPDTVMPQDENEDNQEIFTSTEVSPMYPGGIEKFQEYVKKNARYSPEAKKSKTSGKVIISFLVEKDGTLRDFQIQKGVNDEFNQEAIRLTRESGKWIPGKKNGKVVDASYTLEVALEASGG